MTIPDALQQAIQFEMERFGWKEIVEARKELTDRYRSHQKQNLMTKDEHRWAYIASRMPATYAVIYRVLQEIKWRLPNTKIERLLDLGAGPGTAMWAACELFGDLNEINLIEKDAHVVTLGQRLADASPYSAVKATKWQIGDLTQLKELPQADLITLSYSIGELPTQSIAPLIEMCWNATNACLVIIEPGTPQGFERIRAVRRQLIDLQAHIVAPCPHALKCPMANEDWCHFAARVERSDLHRRIKEGELGYEDEKYSYIAVSKIEAILPEARVLRHPMRRSGHVNLTLCTPDGLKQETISKKQRDIYKQARKVKWGSSFPQDIQSLEPETSLDEEEG